MLPVTVEEGGETIYNDRQRPFLQSISTEYCHVVWNSTTYQKLFGLYLLATITMASFESFSIGYTPHDALG